MLYILQKYIGVLQQLFWSTTHGLIDIPDTNNFGGPALKFKWAIIWHWTDMKSADGFSALGYEYKWNYMIYQLLNYSLICNLFSI